MEETKTIKGLWWAESQPEKKVKGTLDIINGRDLELITVEYLFEEHYLKNAVERLNINIVGKSIDGDFYHLINCRLLNVRNPENHIEYIFNCKNLIIKQEQTKFSDLVLNEINIDFFSINTWIQDFFTGINFESNTEFTTYKYTKLVPINISEINDDLSIKIDRIFSDSFAIIPDYLHSTRLINRVRIISKHGYEVGKAEYYLKLLQDFLSLAMQKSIYPLSITGLTLDNKPVKIILKYREGNVNKRKTSLESLFFYDEIRDDFQNVLKKWFDIYETESAWMHLVISILYNKELFIENKFLHYIQALEGYHRNHYSGQYFDNLEFKDKILPILKKSIPHCISNKEFLTKLEDSYSYINEYSLRKRVKDIFKDLPDNIKNFFESNEKTKDIINNICNLRNLFSHNLDNKESMDSYDNKLLKYCKILECLMIYLCLISIGIEKDKSGDMVIRYFDLY